MYTKRTVTIEYSEEDVRNLVLENAHMRFPKAGIKPYQVSQWGLDDWEGGYVVTFTENAE